MKYNVIYSKRQKSEEIVNHIKEVLKSHTIDEVNPDFVIAVGGDGTYLRAVRKYFNIIDKVKFISINSGNLGFYSNLEIEDIKDLDKILIGSFETVEHDLIKFSVNGTENYAINEVAVYTTPFIGKYSIYIDNKFLENYAGNGLVVSTQTGSTGLNRSLNGSIIDEKIHGMQLTEAAGLSSNVYHSLHNSIILDSSRKILIESNDKGNYCISYDTEQLVIKDEIIKLEVEYSNLKVKNIKLHKKDFIERVQKSFLN